ncbi:MAG: AmmeMemoRadiSam system protein B [Clostridiales bacterium]|nr:AmmeMemoRadiSam system protein B [Clostridiales bacterium]
MIKLIKMIIFAILTVNIILSGFNATNKQNENYYSMVVNDMNFFDEKSFFSTISVIEKNYENVSGMIIPHHLLASEMIHQMFLMVKNNDFDHIMIIGPDHNSKNGLQISISENDWKTPFGVLKNDRAYGEWLKEYQYVQVDDLLMQEEHSNAALIPFVKYYFPYAEITTIALPSTLTKEEAILFGEFLAAHISIIDTLVIASLDFSHYLLYEEAETNDKKTLELIQNRNLEGIYRLDNGFVDSPQTLVSFLTCMNKIRSDEEIMIDHKNSFFFTPDEKQGTTSYFTFIYR